MKQLEIIITRIPAFPKKDNYQDLIEILKVTEKIGGENAHIGFFQNNDAPDDYAIIAVLPSYNYENNKSDLGIFLVDAMRHFGLVSYSCWKATDIKDILN